MIAPYPVLVACIGGNRAPNEAELRVMAERIMREAFGPGPVDAELGWRIERAARGALSGSPEPGRQP
jgi:hypothetical protein